MTRGERHGFAAATVVVALSRLVATARSFWDWDEALFISAVRDYDVAAHHPHPPGYPLFIALARLVHAAGFGEFESLQVVTTVGAMLLFPALFFFAREVGLSFLTSLTGGLIFSFLPNVWMYGGTGFSDVPAAALAFAGGALLLRGRRSDRAFLLGALVLGAAAGIRTTSLLIGAVPAILACRPRVDSRRGRLLILGAASLGALVIVVCYGGAVLASHSPAAYLEALETQRRWVHDVDSWRGPMRPSLLAAARVFWLHPVQHDDLMNPVGVLAAIGLIAGLVRRNRAVLLILSSFVPLAFVSWLQLDIAAAGRYAIAYMPIHALLAAEGLAAISALAARRERAVQMTVSLLLVAVMLGWSLPLLAVVRVGHSPPVAAIRWAVREMPASSTLVIHAALQPHADALALARPYRHFKREVELAGLSNAWVVWETRRPGAVATFTRTRGRLWTVARQRNFESSVTIIGPGQPR